ncbi:MAG TPA: hypothetical protein VGR93_04970 [Candidatus Acidoferrales bacterium]|nr:hypothetical protein [Candidatus Acidoferrales bacterium]
MRRLTLTWTAMGSLLLALPATVRAQAGQASSTVPVLSSGQMPSATPALSEAPPNVLTLGLTARAHYDDNALVGAVPRQWDMLYMVSPRIAFTETRPRLEWGLSYAPGVNFSQNLLHRNQFEQQFNGNFNWLVSPHGLLAAQEYYLVSTDPFSQLGGAVSPGPTVSPNQGPYIPNIRRTMTLSNALYSYRFSERTSAGIGGDFLLSKYDNTPRSGPTTALIQTQRSSGKAYVSHQISARNSIGAQYSIQDLRFPRWNARTTTNTILIFDQVNLSPTSSLTIYGGPDHTNTFNQVQLSLGFIIITIPVKAQQWSGAGGVIYHWTGNRVGVSLDFTRGVSDGGGLVGAVELNSGRADISWRLSKRWSLMTSAGGDSETLLATSNDRSLLTYRERVGLSQQITQKMAINWYYERLNQTGGFGNFPVGNHDFVGASLTYSLMRPIGR